MDWDARPSIPPRRQGRRGRAFDFAQWYPRVVVYDQYGWDEHPLYPAGEFYGEFGTFLVRLDVPEDEVIGATGVPVCGDPGWAHASRQPRPARSTTSATYYGDPAALQLRRGAARRGRPQDRRPGTPPTCTTSRCRSIPTTATRGARSGNVAVHVLYQPGDERAGAAAWRSRRTETALAWLDQTFGTFPWPQITNVHRIEGGGTEFPMMIMDGSAGQGLIVSTKAGTTT